MDANFITFTTDFGEGSPYVAQMKGAALAVNPSVQLIDVTHSIPPQDVRRAALVLDEVAPQFPDGTIHVCVVDPGVGTDRAIVYARLGSHQFVAPDNGALSLVSRRWPCSQVISLTASKYWRPRVSTTFHGRDIMAPVAAHVSRGAAPDQLGSALAKLVQLSWPEVERDEQSLTGSVLYTDRFGNLITDIMRPMLPDGLDRNSVTVTCQNQLCRNWVSTYGQRPAGTLVVLIGSSDRLEMAVVEGNAATVLGAQDGDPVHLSWV